ncbi:MAG: hypothetical protein A2V74_09190 [Acidobacteria bacterium RBG_16_70_10]|nr:MAG: hypothetical protein A2V74_09190 [Acidobacteria bacterium RBG_16_70_10]
MASLTPLRRTQAAALLSVTAAACGGGGQVDLKALSSASDKIVWDAGQKALGKKDYEAARQYFRRIIDGFPNSTYQPGSRLALADTYMQEGGTGSYVLAVAEYREFLTLFPSDPKADYAQFQAAEAYFRQRNSSDRDQTQTLQALEEYQRLLDVYPQSSYAETARERIRVCRRTLARHEFQVGLFYQRTRQAYRAAIGRYQGLLTEYPDYERIDEVLFRLAECLAAAGRGGEALPLLDRLLKEFPASEYVDEARKLESTLPPMPPPAVETPKPPPPASQP